MNKTEALQTMLNGKKVKDENGVIWRYENRTFRNQKNVPIHLEGFEEDREFSVVIEPLKTDFTTTIECFCLTSFPPQEGYSFTNDISKILKPFNQKKVKVTIEEIL